MDPLMPDVVTVAINRVDGGVTIMKVITCEYQVNNVGERVQFNRREPTPAYIESLIAKRYEPIPGHPNGVWNAGNGKRHVSWRIVPNDFVDENTDRTYRNAWKDDGRDKPGHDMAKARNVHREHLRNARAPRLDELDIDYQRADEQSDQGWKRDVVARKQKLRDVTDHPDIEAAQTIEELRALTLEELTK